MSRNVIGRIKPDDGERVEGKLLDYECFRAESWLRERGVQDLRIDIELSPAEPFHTPEDLIATGDVSESRPMAVKDPVSGQWSGYNARMAADLAGALGVKLEFIDQPYATIIPSLLTGRCDIVMAPLFANAERAQVVAFTNFYSSQGLKMMVPVEASAKTWEELDKPSVTFAAPSGTQNEAYIRSAFPNAQLRAIVSDNAAAYLMELAGRRVDALITDANSATVFIRENPQARLKLLEPERTANPTGRAYAVRPDDRHFLNFLNVWMEGAKTKYPQE